MGQGDVQWLRVAHCAHPEISIKLPSQEFARQDCMFCDGTGKQKVDAKAGRGDFSCVWGLRVAPYSNSP